MIQVIWIRHGATAGNEDRRYIGRTDAPLSENGRIRLAALHDSGRLPAADIIFASPMKRCLETAAILYPEKKPILIPNYREIDFGTFEGKNAQELLQNPDSGYQEWIDSNGTMSFPGGESRAIFVKRCRKGFDEMMRILCSSAPVAGRAPEKSASPAGSGVKSGCQKDITAAAIVHGGTIMSVLSGLCGGNYYDYMCGNGEGFRMTMYYDGTKWNAKHLGKVPAKHKDKQTEEQVEEGENG